MKHCKKQHWTELSEERKKTFIMKNLVVLLDVLRSRLLCSFHRALLPHIRLWAEIPSTSSFAQSQQQQQWGSVELEMEEEWKKCWTNENKVENVCVFCEQNAFGEKQKRIKRATENTCFVNLSFFNKPSNAVSLVNGPKNSEKNSHSLLRPMRRETSSSLPNDGPKQA